MVTIPSRIFPYAYVDYKIKALLVVRKIVRGKYFVWISVCLWCIFLHAWFDTTCAFACACAVHTCVTHGPLKGRGEWKNLFGVYCVNI